MNKITAFTVLTIASTMLCSNSPVNASSDSVLTRERQGSLSFQPKFGAPSPVGETQHGRKWGVKSPKAIFLGLHGIQTFAEWYGPLGRAMQEKGYAVYAIDRRGSGVWSVDGKHPWHQSQRGQAVDWHAWLNDIRSAAEAIKAEYPTVPLYLMGTSWGAKTALGALEEDNGLFAGGVLLSPAFHTQIDPGFLKRRLVIPLGARLAGDRMNNLRTKLTPDRYTSCEQTWQQWFGGNVGTTGNPLLESVSTDFVQQSNEQFAATASPAAVRRIKVPLLAIFGGDDHLVKLHESDTVLQPLREEPSPAALPTKAPKLLTVILRGGTHAMMVEKQGQLASIVDQWTARCQQKAAFRKGEIWLPAYATGAGVDKETGRSLANRKFMKGDSVIGYPTGLHVTEGKSISITTDPDWQRFDQVIGPVGIGGILPEQDTFAHSLAKPFLMIPGKPYFILLAVIRDEQGRNSRQPVLFGSDQHTAYFVPTATGTLSVIANDVTCFPSIFWTNNHGTLHLMFDD
jgi:alpha-beta hydrolase superfamily lysophospholipase